MSCINCVKKKIDGLKMLNQQLNTLHPNDRQLAIQAVVLGVLDRCAQERDLDPRYIQIIDNAYDRAQSLLNR